jgi:hypothetical protein
MKAHTKKRHQPGPRINESLKGGPGTNWENPRIRRGNKNIFLDPAVGKGSVKQA